MDENFEPDEETIRNLQEAVDFAVYAGAAFLIMQHSNMTNSTISDEDRLTGYNEIIEVMYSSVPSSIRPAVVVQAQAILQAAQETEGVINSFLKELDEYGK